MSLTTIETRFLANAEIKEQLQITEVNTTLRAIDRVDAKKLLEQSRLGKLMIDGKDHFKSDEFKAKMENEGISWNLKAFSYAVFNMSDKQLYKHVNLAKAVFDNPNVISEFLDVVKTTLAEDNDFDKIEKGLDTCLYWIKHSELEEVRKARLSAESTDSESTDSEEEGSESESSESDSSDSNCVWTMAITNGISARNEDGNIIYPEGRKQDVLTALQSIYDDVMNS